MANEIQVWNRVMAAAMAIPGVKVERKEYLSMTLMHYCEVDVLKDIIDGHRPSDFIDKSVLEQLAKSVINKHLREVTAISAAMGLPGGWFMAGTIPTDIAQYYYHVFKLAQKLAYIYGFPEFTDSEGNLTQEAQNTLTLSVGAMMGVAIANEGIQQIAQRLSGEVVKRLPQKALTQTVIYPIVKQVAKWIGIKLTKESFAKGISKVIPVVSGAISGGLTYVSFKKGAKKLHKALYDAHIIMGEKATKKDKEPEFASYTEVNEENTYS